MARSKPRDRATPAARSRALQVDPMPGDLRWRFSHGRYYLEDDKYSLALVDKRGHATKNQWEWHVFVPLLPVTVWRTLREAKAWAEAEVRKKRR